MISLLIIADVKHNKNKLLSLSRGGHWLLLPIQTELKGMLKTFFLKFASSEVLAFRALLASYVRKIDKFQCYLRDATILIVEVKLM